ncbi:hypothetical protein [Rickettsia endosymbiont of Culicoides newsteadi]|uniref:hypothetical protein n=1 Tax=Rickettsia endosymbiont of Culicoides newsteadi TaxID=1961830 RepID=UPI0012FF9A6D|nr:hypothetical protein [Rickettsia endosymbiont of Culicoides newsteadi]
MLLISDSSYFSSDYFVKHNFLLYIVNSGEFWARSDGATTSPTSHQLTIGLSN